MPSIVDGTEETPPGSPFIFNSSKDQHLQSAGPGNGSIIVRNQRPSKRQKAFGAGDPNAHIEVPEASSENKPRDKKLRGSNIRLTKATEMREQSRLLTFHFDPPTGGLIDMQTLVQMLKIKVGVQYDEVK